VGKYPSGIPFGGARQGPDRRLRTAVSSADRAESLGLLGAYLGRIIIAAHRAFVSGCVRGPGIAEYIV
jgi:hypothetical protein